MSLLLDALRKAEKSKNAKPTTGADENGRVRSQDSAAAISESVVNGVHLAYVRDSDEETEHGAADELVSEIPFDLDLTLPAEEDSRSARDSRQSTPGTERRGVPHSAQVRHSIFDLNSRGVSRRRVRWAILGAATVLVVFLLSYYGWFLHAALTPAVGLTSRSPPLPAAGNPASGRSSLRLQGGPAAVTSGKMAADRQESVLPSGGYAPAIPERATDEPGEPVGEKSDTELPAGERWGQAEAPIGRQSEAQAYSTLTGGAAEGSNVSFSRGRPRASMFPRLESAYAAYRAGDYAEAESHYRFVLYRQPDNRDALLGMAAIAVSQGRVERAWGLYQRILELNPRDRAALASLMAIQEGMDPLAAERLLSQLLADDPDAAYLHAAAGNLHAAQERWSLAQQAYFDAYHYDRENGDYAYNLAVALDHLGQPQTALRYYRIALGIAGKEAVGFEAEAVRRRVRVLVGGSRPDDP